MKTLGSVAKGVCDLDWKPERVIACFGHWVVQVAVDVFNCGSYTFNRSVEWVVDVLSGVAIDVDLLYRVAYEVVLGLF